jgi:hypothetical protein
MSLFLLSEDCLAVYGFENYIAEKIADKETTILLRVEKESSGNRDNRIREMHGCFACQNACSKKRRLKSLKTIWVLLSENK